MLFDSACCNWIQLAHLCTEVIHLLLEAVHLLLLQENEAHGSLTNYALRVLSHADAIHKKNSKPLAGGWQSYRAWQATTSVHADAVQHS